MERMARTGWRGLGWIAVFAGLSGCEGLDRVPILAGERCAPDREDRVVCTRDGDTFVLEGVAAGEDADCTTGEAVRMLGVDADEIAHPEQGTEAECWGDAAAAWLAGWLREGTTVRLEFDAECTDAYDRTLAYVWLPEAGPGGEDLMLNEQIIREGQAVVYEDFDNIRWAEPLYSAEAAAENSGLGLWGVCQ